MVTLLHVIIDMLCFFLLYKVIVFYQYINGSMVILSLAIILMYLEFSNVL